jgi:hypothetical protein
MTGRLPARRRTCLETGRTQGGKAYEFDFYLQLNAIFLRLLEVLSLKPV